MDRKQNKKLVSFARGLRRNMTKEEKHLWYDFLKNYDVKFNRQKVLGRYIADFYSAELKLVIELDGSQHYDPEAKLYDEERTEFFKGYDIEVVRINNLEITRNFRGVCLYIDKIVKRRMKDIATEE